MKKTKIAHICTAAISHKILADKLALLQRQGYDVHCISSMEGYDPDFMQNYNLTLHFIPMKRSIQLLTDLKSLILLMKLIKREKYDIVHTHTAKAGLLGRVAARLAGVPLIVHTSHGLPYYEGQSKWKHIVYKTLERVASYFCHALSSQNKEDLQKIKESSANIPVYYEGNGVDLNKLDRRRAQIDSRELESIRKRWGIPRDVPVILMAARLEAVKDHFFFLEGLKNLIEQHPIDFVCVLAGDGPLQPEIEQKVKAYKLESKVKMIGHQRDIYPYIQLADVVVLTSQKEGIPRILMESMAYSKPIVATDVLGTRELVLDQVTGILVPYKDVSALADALNIMLLNSELREQLGQEGRTRIEQEFTEELVVARIVKMYRELAK